MSAPKTLYDKIWDAHLVHAEADGTSLLYIDRHLVHEVTSPQAFEGLRMAGRKVRHPEKTIAVPDHNVPTDPTRIQGIRDEQSRIQVEALGIGTSEVEHVLATQTLIQSKSKNMKVEVRGSLPPGVTAKDITLTIIGKTGTAGGTGHVIEYMGDAIQDLSMEGRMTVCNMAIEGGARAGLIAPDQKTFDYVMGRPHAPKGAQWEMAVEYWKSLRSDEGAHWDKELVLDAAEIAPVVTWGTSPEDVLPITGTVPAPEDFAGGKVEAARRSLDYMGLKPGQKLSEIEIDTVFIGSCTNGRIEDLREVAKIMEGHKVKEGLRAMIVPGSGLVRAQAEEEGIAQKLIEAGFDWRMAGCSMCLGMNPDQLAPGERCASTSNRNFEGRQGRGGRTHLLSPAMAAAAAITGRLTDVREIA